MAVNVKVKYQIKIKGQSVRNVGPTGIFAQAKTESAVMEAIRKREYAATKQVESIVILSIQ
ncbi:TPA: hypothetical protein UMV35_000286 [Stenotrophomonas maltophilia]|mgnify:FL=1|uniref:hypothetical protein n=1 Tax=Stenotrophomonas TaxID=40323 RepID=UPI0013103AD5|nr:MULTISPECIES: hypothetical protein [Stenotrophomonas]MBH1590873.1 hypothetical protein [Stenotrophomonas maltophilia]MDH2021706.1 hypothetical protein [Stenotrophomonas sp. GD03680]MDT3432571.1 hypothetical protein [Stenotrophomonas maltophilia]HDS1321637.1 hypothetical protein [Stenotrophomonas maltophilia]HDS1326246.1 hypothetical protein [Stenotrophomonas maltophilia]